MGDSLSRFPSKFLPRDNILSLSLIISHRSIYTQEKGQDVHLKLWNIFLFLHLEYSLIKKKLWS